MSAARLRLLPLHATVLLAAVVLGTPARAQLTTGGVTGRVVNEKREPLAGVVVKLRDAETGLERVATSNGEGSFDLLGLPPATYVVQATLRNYGAPLSTLVVNLGQLVPVTIAMQPGGSIEEKVTVTGTLPLLNQTKTELGTVVTEAQIRSFPLLNRDFNDLAQFAPGVKQAAGGQFDPTKKPGIYTPFTNGGSAGRNLNISIDGADNNDNVVGFFVQGFTAEAVQEFEVIQDQYKAEYGRSSGGVVNVITKSGTNEFHGSLFGTFRNQNLRATNFSESLAGTDKAESYRDSYGFSVGGPILKDRLFFFVAGEKQGEDTPSALNPIITSYAGTEPEGFPFQLAAPGTVVSRQLDRTLLTARLDYHVSPRHLLWLRWALDNADFVNDQGGTMTDPSNDGSSRNRTSSAVLNWQWMIGNRMFNELKVHYNSFVNEISTTSPDPLLTLYYQDLVLGRNGGTPQRTPQKKVQVRDDFTWMAGHHAFKAGLETIQVRLDDSNFSARYYTVSFGFNTSVVPATSMGHGDANGNGIDDGVESIQNVGIGSPSLNPGTRYTQYAAFFQDDWDLTPKWRLSYGLRVDRDQDLFKDTTAGFNRQFYECLADPTDAHRCGLDPATPDPSNPPRGIPRFSRMFPKDPTNFSPRLGFVYQLGGEGKDVIRGSWGLYYDKMYDNLLVFMRGNLSPYKSPAIPGLQGCTDATCSTVQILAGATPVAGYAPLPADFTLANWENPASGLKEWLAGLEGVQGPATFNDSVAMPSPDWSMPYNSTFSAGWGHAFSSRLTLDVNAIYRRGFHQLFNPAWGGLTSGRDAPFPVIVDPETGTAQYPGFMFLITTEGKAEYSALQTSFRGSYVKFDFGLNLNLSRSRATQDFATTYTSNGYSSSDLFQGGNIKFTGGDINSEWGRVTGDQAVLAFLYGTYRFPHAFDLSAQLTYGSPVAFNPYAGIDLNHDGYNSGEEYAGRRGDGRGDDLLNVNARGTKRFLLGKGSTIEVFLEVFNLFNRVNYGVYADHRQFDDYNVPNPNYQHPTGDSLTPPRTLQIGMRYSF